MHNWQNTLDRFANSPWLSYYFFNVQNFDAPLSLRVKLVSDICVIIAPSSKFEFFRYVLWKANTFDNEDLHTGSLLFWSFATRTKRLLTGSVWLAISMTTRSLGCSSCRIPLSDSSSPCHVTNTVSSKPLTRSFSAFWQCLNGQVKKLWPILMPYILCKKEIIMPRHIWICQGNKQELQTWQTFNKNRHYHQFLQFRHSVFKIFQLFRWIHLEKHEESTVTTAAISDGQSFYILNGAKIS